MLKIWNWLRLSLHLMDNEELDSRIYTACVLNLKDTHGMSLRKQDILEYTCQSCGINFRDYPSKYCVGCEAYQDHYQ